MIHSNGHGGLGAEGMESACVSFYDGRVSRAILDDPRLLDRQILACFEELDEMIELNILEIIVICTEEHLK